MRGDRRPRPTKAAVASDGDGRSGAERADTDDTPVARPSRAHHRTWSRDLKEANDANKSAALAWINALRPTGATGTGPATSLGLGIRENKSVVLLTDGAPNCGVPEDDDWYNYNESAVMNGHRRMIRNANSQGATINVFGIAASGSYRSFCQNVAGDSGGSYFDVP